VVQLYRVSTERFTPDASELLTMNYAANHTLLHNTEGFASEVSDYVQPPPLPPLRSSSMKSGTHDGGNWHDGASTPSRSSSTGSRPLSVVSVASSRTTYGDGSFSKPTSNTTDTYSSLEELTGLDAARCVVSFPSTLCSHPL
jgi:hypothetical protein